MNTVEKTKEKNIMVREDVHLEKTLSSAIDFRFVRSKEVLLIDFTKCIQRDSCIQVGGTLYGGQSRLIRKRIRLNNILLIATSCRHCDNPTCMIKCPTGAINRGAAGEIYYNYVCIGCGQCARNCAYGNITMVEAETDGKQTHHRFTDRFFKKNACSETDTDQEKYEKHKPKKKPVKCDMCRKYSFMACVYNCPTGAAQRIDPTEFVADIIGTA